MFVSLSDRYPDRVPPTPIIGCTQPTSGPAGDIGALREFAQTAEDLGFDSVWLSDHVVVPERIGLSYRYRPDGRLPTTAPSRISSNACGVSPSRSA